MSFFATLNAFSKLINGWIMKLDVSTKTRIQWKRVGNVWKTDGKRVETDRKRVETSGNGWEQVKMDGNKWKRMETSGNLLLLLSSLLKYCYFRNVYNFSQLLHKRVCKINLIISSGWLPDLENLENLENLEVRLGDLENLEYASLSIEKPWGPWNKNFYTKNVFVYYNF